MVPRSALPNLPALLRQTALAIATVVALLWAHPGGAEDRQAVAIQDWTAGAEPAPVIVELDFTTQLTLSEGGQTAFVLPLLGVPVEGGPATGSEIMGALVTPGVTTLDDQRLDALLTQPLRMGTHGPVVVLELTALPGDPYRAALGAALAAQGRHLADAAPMLIVTQAGGGWLDRVLPYLGAGAAVLVLLGMTLTMRALSRPVPRLKAAGALHRIAPYIPAMANGENGAVALRQVICAEAARETPLPVYRPDRAPAPTAEMVPSRPSKSPAGGFPDLPRDAYPVSRRTGARDGRRPLDPGASLIATVHFGEALAKEGRMSRRALSRAESDPFVQRLAKLT